MADITWSFSKFRAFEDCPKALWLDEHSMGESRNLVPLHSLLGTSVHRSISFLIDMWTKDHSVSIREVKQVGISLIGKVWKNKNNIIIEYVNGTETDDSVGPKIEKALNTLIEKFFLYIWPTFSNDSYVTHERLFELDIEGYRLLVKPDLITKDLSGNLIITDWKTSATHDDSIESFQVSIYGLWATHYYDIPPERIILQVVNLRTGRRIKGKFSLEKEKETLDTIKSQINKLNAIYQEENPQPKPEFNKCKKCLHLKSCDDGNRILFKT